MTVITQIRCMWATWNYYIITFVVHRCLKQPQNYVFLFLILFYNAYVLFNVFITSAILVFQLLSVAVFFCHIIIFLQNDELTKQMAANVSEYVLELIPLLILISPQYFYSNRSESNTFSTINQNCTILCTFFTFRAKRAAFKSDWAEKLEARAGIQRMKDGLKEKERECKQLKKASLMVSYIDLILICLKFPMIALNLHLS